MQFLFYLIHMNTTEDIGEKLQGPKYSLWRHPLTYSRFAVPRLYNVDWWSHFLCSDCIHKHTITDRKEKFAAHLLIILVACDKKKYNLLGEGLAVTIMLCMKIYRLSERNMFLLTSRISRTIHFQEKYHNECCFRTIGFNIETFGN